MLSLTISITFQTKVKQYYRNRDFDNSQIRMQRSRKSVLNKFHNCLSHVE